MSLSGPLQTLFDNMNKAAGEKTKPAKPKAPTSKPAILEEENQDMIRLDDGETVKVGGTKTKKRLSVERIYQKVSQLEHVLLRPDTYIGSVEHVTQPMWVYDNEAECMVQRDITFVPGLYKIFDEILVNAADNKQRDPSMSCIKIDIEPEKNQIKVWNNGKGIPIVEHKEHNMYVPTMIFGHLLTSSNYDDDQKKVTGGRNGYGAKLCNIFSTKFSVETSFKENGKSFRQTWTNNMSKEGEAKFGSSKSEDYTCITFQPDLSKFKMESLDRDIVDLFSRRAYDIAASSRGVKVFLNGKKLPIKNFKDYVDLYLKNKVDDQGVPYKIVHEIINERWEVAVTISEKGFQQVSFVNSIATTKGGRHVDYITENLITKIIDVVKKKNKGGIAIKPFQVKNHLWVFVNSLIVNPTFDSQTKENMTLQAKQFGSKAPLSEKFITQVNKCGIIENILSWMKFKAQEKLNKQCHGSKHSKLKGIPKLDDANDAGTKNSSGCTLILTEGDSAKTLAVAGLAVVGRDRYGVFPLRGKVLNVREASHKQIMENAEINNIIKIMGLQYKNKYENPDSLKTLRYGKMMIMTDQDQDGSHIKGLLVNFIHHNWPLLLRHRFLEEFITPIVKVTKGKEEHSFYSLPEFEEWKHSTDNWHTWKVKYYKGLGTSTSKEAKEYFSDLSRHRIPFQYQGPEDDSAITLAFSKKKIEERKEWLTNWMEERKRRAQLGLPELYLYGKETKRITYNEFVNRELILFSNMDNERSLPSIMDGLKPGQRKVLFACFKRNLVKEMKVAQLAGSVAELSAYHHGEVSLMGTIIGLAQNFVGSNNINLLQPNGQFGTRLHGGKDAASPRYIFTQLSPLARLLFHIHDDPLLNHLYDDNLRIEPEFYVPIIPMVLVNGASGIGTGWSTNVPNFDVREIVANIKRLCDGREILPMMPKFKGYIGAIEQIDDQRFVISGEVAIIDDQTIEITELPVRTWTQNYKESVLEPMLQGTDKTPATILDYKEYHSDTTVKFVVKMNSEKLAKAEEVGLHKFFKLQSSISISSMVMFDHNGCIHRYDRPEQILQEFYTVRLDYYHKRKEYLVGLLTAESLKLDNQARFICEKIDNTISIENKPKKELIQLLVRRGYDSDPVKMWKETQDKLQTVEDEGDPEDEESVASSTAGGPDFNYILGMPLWNLSQEKKDELLKQRDAKADELMAVKKKSPANLWEDDLEKFMEELEKLEQKQNEDDIMSKGSKAGAKRPKKLVLETKPSPMGRRVEPRIDSAMRQKVEAAVARKKKETAKKTNRKLDIESMLEEDEENYSKDGSQESEKPVKTKRKKTTSGDKTKAKKKSPKKSKRNPWSDSDSESNVSDFSEKGASPEFVIPREVTSKRSAAQKAKLNFGDDESDSLKSSSDDEPTFTVAVSVPKPKTVPAPLKENDIFPSNNGISDDESAAHKNNYVISDDDDSVKLPAKKKVASKPKTNDVGEKKKRAPRKKAPAKKAADAKQPDIFNAFKSKNKQQPAVNEPFDISSDDENDDQPIIKTTKRQLSSGSDMSDGEFFPKPKAKKPPVKKAKKTISDDEFEVSKKPSPKKKASKKKKMFDSDDSDDDLPKGKSTASKKNFDDDGEFLPDENLGDVAPRSRTGRTKQPVAYKFEDSDDEDDLI